MSLYLGDMPIANDGSHRLTGEIGDMGFAPLGIDESLNLRRYLNGQVISQSLSPSFTTKVKQAIALFTNLGTTESNWQSEKTLSKLGQCGKFVVDDTEGTIRLPAVVNAQGLLSLSGIGNLVNESLPNITGSTRGSINQAGLNWTSDGALYGSRTGQGHVPPSSSDYNFNDTINLDASRSSSTYQNNAPVQQEAVQYPYYIQIATGVEETLPAIREYKVNNSDYFGKSMYSDVAPDNASWLASNGSYNARAVYPDYYDWLVSHIGETITANGGKVVLSTGTITDYDFVVNQNDQTFRLPLLNGEEDLPSGQFETWTLGNSGQIYPITKNGFLCLRGVSAAATDYLYISQCEEAGTIDVKRGVIALSRGVGAGGNVQLYLSKGSYAYVEYAGWNNKEFTFNVAKGNGTLYYYVGDTVQDASLINAGAVLGQLSNKADIDLSNLSTTGKSAVVDLSAPDYTAGVDYVASWGTNITTTKSGWVFVSTNDSGSGSQAQFHIEQLSLNVVQNSSPSYGINGACMFFVPANATWSVSGGNGYNRQLYFFPCKGA